jgi:transcriptional regulator with XRE-family HTH domain
MSQTTPFARRLRQLRDAAGLTQGQLAEKAGLHRQGIAKLEMGDREPAWGTVQALAKALGVTCSAFEEADAETAKPSKPRGRPKKGASQGEPAPVKKRKRREKP